MNAVELAVYMFQLIFLWRVQTQCQLHCSYRLASTDFLQRVLTDSTSPEFPLGNVRDPRQLFVIGNSVPSPPVLDGFEFQQTQVFTLFPMPVVFLPDVDRRPVRNNVRPLQQSVGRERRIQLARLRPSHTRHTQRMQYK
jgi:hypothetical protein